MTGGPENDTSGPSRGTRPLRVLLLNWRDTGHLEGGGSEVYAERVADGLADLGHDITLFTAGYAGAADEETRVSGARVVRRGSHQSVYLWAPFLYRRRGLGRPDVVIEVHNGMPFLARSWVRRHTPVVVLVHHVHREQWHVVFGALRARLGWFLESGLAPRVNRRCDYIAVSDVTKAELAELGVPVDHIRVIHNGTLPPLGAPVGRSEHPSMLVLGRLVPHKRVEIAIEALAQLRTEFPTLTLTVAGRGWWQEQLRAAAQEFGVEDSVHFAGFVSPHERHRLYSQSWVSLMPSLKEGWGLVVVEAGAHGTPSVAFDGAGGVTESIVDGVTGLLAVQDDIGDFVDKVRALLRDESWRERLGQDAAVHARQFDWDTAVKSFEGVVTDSVDRAGRGSRARRTPTWAAGRTE